MAIQVYCHCGNPLFVPAELAGRKIKCNTCGQTLKVPQAESEAPDPDEQEKLQQSGRYEVVGGVPASARTKLQSAGKQAGAGASVQLSCPACGGKVEIEDAACLSCGAELGGGARPGQGSGLLGSVPRPVLFLVVVVVGFGGLGLLAWRLWLGSRPASYTAEGLAAMSDKDWGRAREMFELALEYDPGHTEAVLNLGVIAAETHNGALINKWVPRALDLCKDKRQRARLRLAHAEDLLGREKYREAYNAANEAGHDDPTIHGVAAIKGISALFIYDGAKADEEAHAFLKEAVGEGEQRDWRIYYHLGRIQVERKELEEGRKNAEQALELFEESPELWWLLARLREDAGETGPAKTALKKVVELQPENAAAYIRLSRLYLLGGDADAARSAALKAKELDPESAAAALAVGRACVSLEQWPQAKEELERAVKGNAGWEAEYLLGETYYRGLKDPRSGAQAINRGLDRQRDPHLYQKAGRIALEAGDTTTAVTILQRGLALEGRNYEMRLYLAQALGSTPDLRKRNDRQILECLEAARELTANRPEAWQELAVQHLELGRTKEALEVIDAGLQACPGNVDLLHEKGRICVAAGADKCEEAIEALEQLQKLRPGYKETKRLLDEAYELRFYKKGQGG